MGGKLGRSRGENPGENGLSRGESVGAELQSRAGGYLAESRETGSGVQSRYGLQRRNNRITLRVQKQAGKFH